MLRHDTWQGAPALTLENATVRATVVPAHGGKIAQIVHVPSGRDWLWHNAQIEPRTPVYDGDYAAEHDVGGWDECFPAVRPGFYPVRPWRGTRIPDHGELWGVPWDVADYSDAHARLVCRGTHFPYTFSRTVRLTPEGLCLDYEVENAADEPFPFLWCAHPLLTAAPGMLLRLPQALGSFRIYSGGPFMQAFDPPEVLPEPGSFAIKCFAPIYAAGTVALADGEREFRLSYEAGEATYLNLWLNCGTWAGVPNAEPYYNVGLEPGIGPADDLDLAVSHLGECGLLPPRAKQTWSLRVTLK